MGSHVAEQGEHGEVRPGLLHVESHRLQEQVQPAPRSQLAYEPPQLYQHVVHEYQSCCDYFVNVCL